MSSQRMNFFPRFTQHLVASGTFASEPLVVVDVGARGGFQSHWSFYGQQVKLVGFEADTKECERLNQQASKPGNHFFPIALHQYRSRRPFYVTACPLNSGFYPPDTEFCQRLSDEASFAVERAIEVDTVDFDSFASENHIDSVDFIKLNTEGSELDILKGATKFLKKSVIGLSIEVEFLQLHKDQPIFSDVDSFLRPLGFKLYDLANYRFSRKALPVPTTSPIPVSAERGQAVSGDALYLRDGVDEIKSSNALEDGWNNIRILKLTSIMELFCLPDCAIELIQIAQQEGFLQGMDVGHLIDLLPPPIGGKIVSYDGYLEYVQIIKHRGYLHKIERAKQLYTRFLPRLIRSKVRNSLIRLKDSIDEVLR